MKNLRKLLAVVVMVAVMLTYAIPAFAAVPSDVEGTEYESAVTRLVALGIITGRPDGTFAPNDTINRAEFAAVVIRALGYGTAAEAAKAQTKFSDVGATHWAAGYINLASSLGIIKGRPDGTFGPNDPVLYEEAVTMVVRALGYEPAAAANGGYPTGYLTIASQEEIDDGAVLAVGVPAPRGIVAKLVDNSLEVELMEQVTYGTQTEFKKNGKTLLDNKLKLDVLEARVLSTGDKLEVRYTNSADNPASKRNVKEKLDVFESISQEGLQDCLVTIWVKDGTVYNIKNESTVYYDVISKINGKTALADITTVEDIDDITLKNADSTFDVAADSSDDVTASTCEVKVNRVTVANYAAANSADPLLNKFAKVIVEDGKVVKIQAYAMTEAGIITEIEDDQIVYTKGSTEEKKLKGMDDYDSLLVVIDNAVASYSDLEEDMYFEFSKISDDYVIAASTGKVEGELTRARDDKIAIDGTYTDLAGAYYYSTDAGDSYSAGTGNADDFADLLATDVVAYLNLIGKIVYVKGDVEETTDTFYGFVSSYDSFNDRIKVIKNVDGEAKTVTYDVDFEDTSLDFTDLEGVTEDLSTAPERVDSFYKFTFDSDNVIIKMEAAPVTQKGTAAVDVDPGADVGDDGVDFDKDSDFILAKDKTRIYVTDDTLIFDITAASDIAVLKWADIKGADIAPANDVVAYYAQNDTTNPAFVLLDNSEGSVTFSGTTGYLAFVTSKQRINSDDYEYEVIIPGDTATFVVDDGKLAGSKKFDVIAYKTTSEKDRIEVVGRATYDDLSPLGSVAGITSDDDWDAIAADTVDTNGIDGKYITINGVSYRVADDAIILKVNDDRDEFTESDLSDIEEESGEEDNVCMLLVKGQVKILFFWD